jgi:ubiquinone/menaquinone biosynthesis C-methylase UbiE
MKTESVERFDRTAEGYLRWWAPVLAPASARLIASLGRLRAGLPGGEPLDVIDMGCGTGNLLFEAARRWPSARLVGLDASEGMLEVARRQAAGLPDSARTRIKFVAADAAAAPAPDASFDLVMTGFMIQQVTDRATAMAELFRICRPGGRVAIVGWLTEAVPFGPEAALEEALAEVGVVRPAPRDVKSGHFRTVRQAADELRRAGFRQVSARSGQLEHAWSAEDFITYRTTTRDLDLFEAMTEETRGRTLEALRRRLTALAPDDLVFRPPIVSIVARKG